MIPLCDFLKPHITYIRDLRKAEKLVKFAEEDCLRSTESLIAHPLIPASFKTKLLKFRRELMGNSATEF